MNVRHVLRQLGLVLLSLSLGMGIIATVEWFVWAGDSLDERQGIRAMGLAAGVGGLLGAIAFGIGLRSRVEMMNRREALLLVSSSWIIGAAVSGLPYLLWAVFRQAANPDHVFLSYSACYFEAMSGLTTTGATVLSDIGELPRSLLLWRALTHWLGGLGIVVLFVAVLPMIGVGGKRLFHAEAPGPQQQGVRPRIKETARVLWLIYMGITLAAGISYKLAGMSTFDAICHSFSVVSTGGLSTRDASIGHYDSVAIDMVSIVFMLLAGVNFGLMFLITRGQWRTALRDEELRVYLVMKLLVVIIVAANIMGTDLITTAGRTIEASAMQALRFAGFQTISLHTGTGFCTSDYDLWPMLSRALLIGLMFVGGCAGSTAGGIKVIRFWIVLKVIYASLERSFRPNVVRPLRVGQAVVDNDQKLNALTYCVFFLLVVAVGALVIGLLEHQPGEDLQFLTAATASMSTMGNIGPGFFKIGATQNYGWFSDPSLVLMSLLMLLGRLEIYAFAVLLLPRFWRGD